MFYLLQLLYLSVILSGFFSYRCVCKAGFTGEKCENKTANFTESCAKNPSLCQNNGSCKSTKEHGAQCVCPKTHYGAFCEKKHICLTDNNPCLNNAECIMYQYNKFR